MLQRIIVFGILGLIGAIVNVLVKAKRWEDLKKFQAFKNLCLGFIAGLIYYFLYSEWNFPNSIMTIVSGYFGADFIISVVSRFSLRRKK